MILGRGAVRALDGCQIDHRSILSSGLMMRSKVFSSGPEIGSMSATANRFLAAINSPPFILKEATTTNFVSPAIPLASCCSCVLRG
jgi:hypothetical protein